MSLVKNKQIADIHVDKITDVSGDKNFVTNTQLVDIDTIGNKIESTDIADKVTSSALTTTLEDYATTSTLESGYVTLSTVEDASTGLAPLTDGKISISKMPDGSLQRVINVADETARFALTSNDVQIGDTVKQNSDAAMYIVKDGTNLDNANGYTSYVSAIKWSSVANGPNSTVENIDATVAKKDKIGYLAEKTITIDTNGQTIIETGIMTDGTTSYFTDLTYDIGVCLNGFTSIKGAGKDYTVSVVSNEVVITWLDPGGLTLETTDDFVVKYTQLVA